MQGRDSLLQRRAVANLTALRRRAADTMAADAERARIEADRQAGVARTAMVQAMEHHREALDGPLDPERMVRLSALAAECGTCLERAETRCASARTAGDAAIAAARIAAAREGLGSELLLVAVRRAARRAEERATLAGEEIFMLRRRRP